MGRKWKAKCKIEKDGQKWIDNDVRYDDRLLCSITFKPE